MKPPAKIALFFVSLTLLSFNSAFSQSQSPAKNQTNESLLGIESNTKSFSLLDPNRFRMSHSYTFSYFSSGKTSGSFGVYTNVLEYKFSNPLTLTLSLNYLHQPLSVFHKDHLRMRDAILPNFQLLYKPNDSFSFTINVLTFPYLYQPRNPELWLR
ncbi:MAG: hypothetical protein AMJ73_05890 [candidate division Zixibacteria bacterium SM1_73]|nr:MAG: hypothetical protein AMJ73_05890 [candidate division Zixibacteria bacterium SM1_73]